MGRLQRSGQSWGRFSLKLPPSAQCSSGCCRGVLLLLTEVGITWELLCTLHMAHHTACFFSLLVTCSRMDCVCSVVVLINSFVVVKIFFNTHMYPIKQTGRKGQKVKDDGTHFFLVPGWLLDWWAESIGLWVQDMQCARWIASAGTASLPGYVLHPQAVLMQGYHRFLTSCSKLAKTPGNVVPVLDSLMNLKRLESCVNNQ